MNSEKAWYWIAVGTLAIVLGNTFLTHSADRLQCVAYQSLGEVHRVTELALAHFGRAQARIAPIRPMAEADVAEIRAQAFAGVQAELAQRRAELAQLEVVRPRLAQVQVVVRDLDRCPRRHVQSHADADPDGNL